MKMPILALQRSYKYMMYATKQPTLRIKQADLKCRSGCGFFGNAEWEGESPHLCHIYFVLSYSLKKILTIVNCTNIYTSYLFSQ